MENFKRIIISYPVIFLVINFISILYYFVFQNDYNWSYPYLMSGVDTIIVLFLKKEKQQEGRLEKIGSELFIAKLNF